MTEKIEDNQSDRRSFIRKLAAAAGVGVATLVLQQELIKSVSAAGAAGQIAFYTAPNTLNGDNNLFWNNTNKRLGVGTTGPARAVHLVGNNAVFRMDRDADSSAFILVRTASGTIWKTFYVGVDASGVNDGSFFIGDAGTAVSGASAKRLIIDNTGNVVINNGWLLPGASGSQCIGSTSLGKTWTNIYLDTINIVGQSGVTKIVPIFDDYGLIGTDSLRWHEVRAVNFYGTLNSGDLIFENGFRVTEDASDGLAFINARDEKIATLDSEGNLRIKGRIIEQQDLGIAERAKILEEKRS